MLALALWTGAAGCASAPAREATATPWPRPALEARGPGQVFPTAEAAAFDALVWCQAEAVRAGGRPAPARGGTVFPVDGGFSYAEPAVADGASPRLRYRMRPGDVLHFRHYPTSAASVTGPRRHALPLRDRRLVERGDPLQRPIYYMTPDRRIRMYAAGERDVSFSTLAGWASVDRAR